MILIAAGLTAFIASAKFGIDFTGGEMVQIRTTTPVEISKIRDIVSKSEIATATVQIFLEPGAEYKANEGTQFTITFSMTDIKVEEGKEPDPHILKDNFKKYLRDNLTELAAEPFAVMERMADADVRNAGIEGLTDETRITSGFYKLSMNLLKPSDVEALKTAITGEGFDKGIAPADKLEAVKVYAANSDKTRFDIILRTASIDKFSDRESAHLEIRASLTSRLQDAGIDISDPFPREQSVGSSLSSELQTMAIWAILLSSIALLIYITFRFTFAFGMGAVVALIHDLFMTIGFISIVGVPITLDVLAAVLTVLGYSLNDTIIVFDRIRENMKNLKKRDFTEVLNLSINQTIQRTVLTAGTTALVIICLLVFAGEVLEGFALTLLVGIITGTYSSVFIATPIVAVYQQYRKGREAAAARMAEKA
jgi:preprotein translocase SecF subunit